MKSEQYKAEIKQLRDLLEEAEATLQAIHSGEVDALVVSNGSEPKVYTLQGADHPYRVLVEAMQQGAVTLSSDGAIVYCNKSFTQMVGRPYETIIGSKVQQYFAPADRPALERLLTEAPTVARQAELDLQLDGGERLPVLVSFSLLWLETNFAGCLVITDLTEQRQNQDLKDSGRRKDEFLAMLAHELRNPLAPISNAVQMLGSDAKERSPQVRWACEVVDRQVRQLTRIVDDLLDVSRLTRGKVNLQLAPADVCSIVAAAIETSRPMIESRKHELHINLPPEPLTVQGDLTRLAQVLTNLLNNAAKYTPEGGQIWLTVERTEREVAIKVRDNGIGIAPEMLPKVFDLFTQAERAIDRSQGGLGIGLTLVRNLVQMHHGTVEAHSAGVGRGSEFVVRLPLLVESPRPAKNGHADRAAHATPAQRILVVDDNVDAAQTLAELMASAGHQTRVAHDGHTALEVAQSFEPTFILLDIGLPGMDGYQVAEQLRAEPRTRHAIVAALTGYGDEQDRFRSKQAGFDHHLVKPVRFDTLKDLLRAHAAATE